MSHSQILTLEQMRGAEAALIAAGTPVEALMERAGRGAAQWVWRMAAGRPVTVLVGPGNNGGDGWVLAEDLRQRGGAVAVHCRAGLGRTGVLIGSGIGGLPMIVRVARQDGRDAVFDGAVPAKTRSAGCAVNAAASIARDASVASPRPHRSRAGISPSEKPGRRPRT